MQPFIGLAVLDFREDRATQAEQVVQNLEVRG